MRPAAHRGPLFFSGRKVAAERLEAVRAAD